MIPAAGRFPGQRPASGASPQRRASAARRKTKASDPARQLQTARARIAELKAALDERDRRLAHQQEVDRRKNQFIATASHDIRTPLRSLLALSDLLREQLAGPLSPEQQRYVDVIHRNGQNLLALADSILDLSRLEAGQVTLSLRSHDLGPLLTAAAANLAPLADRKHLSLVVDVPGDLPPAVCDVVAVTRVMSNLIGNAIKFTDAGTVTLAARAHGTDIDIQVTDNGCGIPASVRQRIFEEFFQVDPAADRRRGGSGLGLAICQRLVRLMEGRLAVDSTVGAGSRFTVTLPRARAAERSAAPARAPAPAPPPAAPRATRNRGRRSEHGAHSPRR